MLKKKLRRIRRRHKRHGSGCGFSGSSTSWDSDSMIGVGLLLSPFLLIGGIGWGLWRGYLFVLEKVLKKCRHDVYAVNRPEHNHRFCGECGAWQTLDISQSAFIEGVWQASEKMEWQPGETRPRLCTHELGRHKMVETEQGKFWICPRCGCWRRDSLYSWQRAHTCPVNEDEMAVAKNP